MNTTLIQLGMIKIYSARDTTEAYIVRGMLEAHGIAAYVNGYYLQGGIGELASHDYASVSITELDADQARKLIEEYDNKMSLAGEANDTDQ